MDGSLDGSLDGFALNISLYSCILQYSSDIQVHVDMYQCKSA